MSSMSMAAASLELANSLLTFEGTPISCQYLITRDEFGSGVVGIKCFCVATFVRVAWKLQHVRQI